MLELENEQKISFGSKTSPRVSFWIRLFVLPIFETKLYKVSDFEFKKNASAFEVKFSQRVRLWNKSFSTWQIFQKINVRKITFRFLLLRENHIFFRLFKLSERHHFELKTLQPVRFRSKRNYNLSNFFWKLYNVSVFKKECSPRHNICFVEE